MAAKKLIYYLIPLIVLILLIIWIYTPEGLFGGMKKAVKGVIGLAPNVSMGAGELKGEKPTIPKEQEEVINKLKATIKKMLASNKTNCFANYGVLPDLGEKGTSISFIWRENKNLTEIIVKGGAGGKQEVSHEEIKGMKPCVIAGSKDITKNFFEYFIDFRTLNEPYFKQINSILIFNEGKNHIEVPEFGKEPVNNQKNNFESEGWLFKAEDGIICFFPTNYYKNYDEDGIANEWFSIDESGSIPWLVAQNPFIKC